MAYKIAVLPGDGIGPEVITEAVKVVRAASSNYDFEEALIGGIALLAGNTKQI